jgi:ubiquinone biosynthesis monooxygenase Coq7
MRLPGDIHSKEDLSECIRVNHAGEYAAKNIYEAQLKVFKKQPKVRKVLAHMYEQEKVHLSFFEEQLKEHKVRPSALMPIWHIASKCLGFTTALMGEKAAMACTVAVEEAIDEHYQSQISRLDKDYPEFIEHIEKFRSEELEHKDIALDHKAVQAPLYPLMHKVIKNGCKLAIKLAKKI